MNVWMPEKSNKWEKVDEDTSTFTPFKPAVSHFAEKQFPMRHNQFILTFFAAYEIRLH